LEEQQQQQPQQPQQPQQQQQPQQSLHLNIGRNVIHDVGFGFVVFAFGFALNAAVSAHLP
jgi:hypothetical protein